MSITAEERAEISRQNGRKSRGPSSAEGKARSSGNAFRHGLRAEALPLPHEDPDVVAARLDEWHEHFRPSGPVARHLVDRCVRAMLLAERCEAYHNAAIARQVRRAEERWEYDRVDEVERLRATLDDDPATAVRLLRRSAHGCRWLIGRWQRLQDLVAEQGFLMPDGADEAVRLLGVRADLSQLHRSPSAFRVRLCTVVCEPGVSQNRILELFSPWRVPQELRLVFRPDDLPGEQQCWRMLLELIADQLTTLRAEEARLREEVDVPERAESVYRALVLQDPVAARLFLRYHAESRNAFQRADKALLKVNEDEDQDQDGTLEPSGADRSSAAPDPVAPTPLPLALALENSPNEPSDEPPISPNEPGETAGAELLSPEEAVPVVTSEAPPTEAREGVVDRPVVDPATARIPRPDGSTPPVIIDELLVGLPFVPAQIPNVLKFMELLAPYEVEEPSLVGKLHNLFMGLVDR